MVRHWRGKRRCITGRNRTHEQGNGGSASGGPDHLGMESIPGDDTLWGSLVYPLPEGVRLTSVWTAATPELD